MHPRRVRHRLVDHLRDAECGHAGIEPERRRHFGRDGAAGGLDVERDLPAREPPRVDAPERDVGVGDGRGRTPAPVSGGTGVGAGAVGPYRDASHGVDPGDRAAAGADLHHLDDRDAQRNAAALGEARLAVDLELARGLRREVVDEADLGGGAAHVEGDDPVEPHLRCDPGGKDRPAGRTGFDEPDGEPDRGIQAREPAARGHEQHRAGEAPRFQPGAQTPEVARHQRLHVGVRGGGAEPLVLADLGADFARQGDCDLRQRGGDDLARLSLVGGIGVAVKETDADAFDPELRQYAGRPRRRRLVQGFQHPSVYVDPLRHHKPTLARHERGWLLDHDVVLVVTALVADVEHVAEAFGGDEGGEGALALDDRVGRERGAMDEQPDGARRHARAREHVVDAGQHRIIRSARGREYLGGGEGAIVLQHHVGERPAHVHADSRRRFHLGHDSQTLLRFVRLLLLMLCSNLHVSRFRGWSRYNKTFLLETVNVKFDHLFHSGFGFRHRPTGGYATRNIRGICRKTAVGLLYNNQILHPFIPACRRMLPRGK